MENLKNKTGAVFGVSGGVVRSFANIHIGSCYSSCALKAPAKETKAGGCYFG